MREDEKLLLKAFGSHFFLASATDKNDRLVLATKRDRKKKI